jgi:hypothetical protein
MKFNTQIKLMRYKTYFDTGLNLSKYGMYLIGFFGLSSGNVTITMIFALLYAVFCYILGYWFLKSGFYRASIEVSNQYNCFVEEVRSKLKKRNI